MTSLFLSIYWYGRNPIAILIQMEELADWLVEIRRSGSIGQLLCVFLGYFND